MKQKLTDYAVKHANHAHQEIRALEKQLGKQAEFTHLCDHDGVDPSMQRYCRRAWQQRKKLRSKLRCAERRQKLASQWFYDSTEGR